MYVQKKNYLMKFLDYLKILKLMLLVSIPFRYNIKNIENLGYSCCRKLKLKLKKDFIQLCNRSLTTVT